MILVDTSALIDWFRDSDDERSGLLDTIEDTDRILICDIVLLEMLQGARDDIHAARIQKALLRFGNVDVLDWNLAIRAAENYRRLGGWGSRSARRTIS
jgi:predicted nucleic acid-binding protein